MGMLGLQLEERPCCSDSWLHILLPVAIERKIFSKVQIEIRFPVPIGLDQSWVPDSLWKSSHLLYDIKPYHSVPWYLRHTALILSTHALSTSCVAFVSQLTSLAG